MTDTVVPEATAGCADACMCVAHVAVEDLQGPVAELRGYLEALARSGGGTDGRLVTAACESGDRVRDVVDALSAYAYADRAAVRRPIALGPVVAAAAEMVDEELSARQVAVQVGPLPEVVADSQQLYCAMVVLLREMAAVGAPGTALTVRALRRTDEWQLRVGFGTVAALATPPDGRSATLRGVKLLIVRRAVEAHGGTLWFSGDSTDAPAVWFTIPDDADGAP